MRHPRVLVCGVIAVLIAIALGLLFLRGADPVAPEQQARVGTEPAKTRGVKGDSTRAESSPRALRPMPAATVVTTDAPNGAFAGRVVSDRTGEGIPGAELTFAQEGGGATSVSTRADGAFEFIPTSPGRWQLASVLAEGHWPFGPEWGRSPIFLSARAGQRVEGLLFAVTPRIIIEGRVEDAKGQPIAGAQVRVIPESDASELFPAEPPQLTSDASGAFRLDAFEGMQVEAYHVGFHPTLATVSAEVMLAKRWVLRLEAGTEDRPAPERDRVLAGVVEDTGGHPLPDAHVRLSASNATWPRSIAAVRTTRTDAAGRFRIEALDDGEWDVAAHHEGYEVDQLSEVRSGRTDLRLTLHPEQERDGVTLSGAVVDQSGRPVPAYALAVHRREGLRRVYVASVQSADPFGEYRVTGLLPGAYAVEVAAKGWAPAEALVEIRPDTQGVVRLDFRLSQGLRLSGIVTDAETHAPLPRARISVEGQSNQGELSVRFDTTCDEEGRFELDGLAEGELSLHVLAEGHHSRIIGGVRPRPGPPTLLKIALRPTQEGEDPRLELMGIGAVLSAQESVLLVGQVIPGGGAAEAGLAPGDAIVAIDGQPVVELGFVQSVQRIRGPENSRVILDVRKAGEDPGVRVPVFRRRLEF